MLKEYQQVIADQLEEGIIEVCNPTDALRDQDNSVHYMPHHPVIKQDHATTKVRIVYDGSAKAGEDGLSLNDCLQTEQTLYPNCSTYQSSSEVIPYH